MSIEEMVANLRLPVSSFLSEKLLWCALLEMYRVEIICFLMLGCSGGVGLFRRCKILLCIFIA